MRTSPLSFPPSPNLPSVFHPPCNFPSDYYSQVVSGRFSMSCESLSVTSIPSCKSLLQDFLFYFVEGRIGIGQVNRPVLHRYTDRETNNINWSLYPSHKNKNIHYLNLRAFGYRSKNINIYVYINTK